MIDRRLNHSLEDSSTAWDTAIEWEMGALLAFAPLAFGATQAWSQEIVFLLIGGMGLCLLAKLIADPTRPAVWTWTYGIIFAFLLLTAFQLIPLPATIVRLISPSTISLKASLLQGLPAADARAAHTTFSFYPYATWQQLRLVLAVSTVFLIVLHVYRDTARIQRLLITIVVVGLAVASIAAYQNVSGSTLIYGLVPAMHRNSGPFMNYSHFGQFMNLSVGAAVALILFRLAEVLRHEEDLGELVRQLKEPANSFIWAAVALCVAGPVLVCLSMTRMGVISLLIAAIVTGLLLSRRGRGRAAGKGSILFMVGLLAFGALLYVGFDTVYTRLATVRHIDAAAGSRTQLLKDAWTQFKEFPAVGTGLGSYEFVHPFFDHLNLSQIATHAENEYAQLLTESGIIGLVLALAFAGSIIAAYLKVVWRPVRAIDYAAYGLGLGLIAIFIHSGSDFGQHVPSNAILTAIFAALLVNLSSTRSTRSAMVKRPIDFAPFVRWVAISAACLVVAAVMVPTLLAADSGRRAEHEWLAMEHDAADLQQINWQGTPEDYRELLTHATAAADLQPTNITYRYWLNVYRWWAISHDIDPATHQAILSPESLGFAARIVDELESARSLCPSYGPPLSVAGQLKTFVLDDNSGINDIRLAYRMTPNDPTVCMVLGAIAARLQTWDEALTAYQRYDQLGGSTHVGIDMFVQMHQPDLAYTLAANDRPSLQYLAEQVKTSDPALSQRCVKEAETLLVAEAQAKDVSAATLADLANLYQSQARPTDAIEYYRRALALDYGQVSWRVQLANSLATADRYNEAARELQICLRQRPKMPEAETLLAQYAARVRPGTDNTIDAGYLPTR